MTNKRIPDLTAATTPLAGTELVPVWDGTTTKQVSVDNLTTGKTVTTGNQIIGSGSSFAQVQMRSSAGGGFDMSWQTGTSNRWILEKAGAEGGANAGSDLFLYRYTDAGAFLGQAWLIKRSTGDFTNYSQYIVGTSGKGIDFSAVTPAAGMTSKVLTNYEEGTWTPVVTAGVGAITSYTSSGTYTRIGRLVTYHLRVDITNNGTGGVSLTISGMPFSASSANQMSGATRESNVIGTAIVASGLTATSIYLTTATNTYPGGTGYGFSMSITQST